VRTTHVTIVPLQLFEWAGELRRGKRAPQPRSASLESGRGTGYPLVWSRDAPFAGRSVQAIGELQSRV